MKITGEYNLSLLNSNYYISHKKSLYRCAREKHLCIIIVIFNVVFLAVNNCIVLAKISGCVVQAAVFPYCFLKVLGIVLFRTQKCNIMVSLKTNSIKTL